MDVQKLVTLYLLIFHDHTFILFFSLAMDVLVQSLKIINGMICALTLKQCCGAVFISEAETFDTVHHAIIFSRLSVIGVSDYSLGQLSKYITERMQNVKLEHVLSQPLCHMAVYRRLNPRPQITIFPPSFSPMFLCRSIIKIIKSQYLGNTKTRTDYTYKCI